LVFAAFLIFLPAACFRFCFGLEVLVLVLLWVFGVSFGLSLGVSGMVASVELGSWCSFLSSLYVYFLQFNDQASYSL